MKNLESETYAEDKKTLDKILYIGIFAGVVGVVAGEFLGNESLGEFSYGFLNGKVAMSVFYQFKEIKKGYK